MKDHRGHTFVVNARPGGYAPNAGVGECRSCGALVLYAYGRQGLFFYVPTTWPEDTPALQGCPKEGRRRRR